MSQKEKDEVNLKQTVLDFLTDINIIFTESVEQRDITIITFFFKKLHPEFVMKLTVQKLYPHKKQIEEQNIKFFDENRYIFSGLPDDRILYYRDVFIDQKRISKNNMLSIWEYLEAMIAYAEPYVDVYR